MKKACLVSKHLTLNEGNVVYMGFSNPKEFVCAQGLCAVRGSIAYPAKTLTEVQEIVEKRFTLGTPVIISIAPGTYGSGNVSSSIKLLPNIVGMKSPLGGTTLKTDLIVENHFKLEIQNITLEGRLEVRAHGEHRGEFLWKGGELLGSYVFDVREDAKHSFILQDVHQNVVPDTNQVYDNVVSLTDNASGILQKLRNEMYSPLKSKLTLLKQATLQQTIENCVIVNNGEENDYEGSSSHIVQYLNNKIEKPINVRNEGNFYTNIFRDSSSIKRTWDGNHFTVTIEKEYAFLEELHFDKSTVELSLLNNTYKIKGAGKIRIRKMYNNSRLVKDSSNNSIEALEESEFSMLEELHDEARSYSILDRLNINVPLRQEARDLYDSVQFVETLLNSRINSFGYKNRLSQNSSSICTSNNNFFSCREKGYYGESNVSDNAVLKLIQNNNTRNLINQVDKHLFDFEISGNASVTTNTQGNKNNYQIRKKNVKNCCVYNMISKGQSKYVYNKNSGTVDVTGGGLQALSLSEKSQHKSSISNTQYVARDLETSLESVFMSEDSQGFFHTSNMVKDVDGGSVYSIHQTGNSHCEYTSTGNMIQHKSSKPCYLTNMSGSATQKLICTNSIRKVETILKQTETRDASIYESLCSNSQYTSDKTLYRNIAQDTSKQKVRGNSLLMKGDSHFENVDTTYSNTEYEGNRKCLNGQHDVSDCKIVGLFQILGGSLSTNFSKFKNEIENIISENTEQSHNLTTFETNKSNNILSKASDGDLVKILLKTCNFSNTNKEIAHIKAIHDLDKKSLTEIATGVLHTTSKILIDSDLKEKVALTYSESFKNEIKEAIKARVGTLVKNSNDVETI